MLKVLQFIPYHVLHFMANAHVLVGSGRAKCVGNFVCLRIPDPSTGESASAFD
jgi:hypothetical protein